MPKVGLQCEYAKHRINKAIVVIITCMTFSTNVNLLLPIPVYAEVDTRRALVAMHHDEYNHTDIPEKLVPLRSHLRSTGLLMIKQIIHWGLCQELTYYLPYSCRIRREMRVIVTYSMS